MSAAIFGLIWLAFILENLLVNGVSALGPHLFTESTPPPGEKGGLANAIVGSLIMTSGAVIIGTPIAKERVGIQKIGCRGVGCEGCWSGGQRTR